MLAAEARKDFCWVGHLRLGARGVAGAVAGAVAEAILARVLLCVWLSFAGIICSEHDLAEARVAGGLGLPRAAAAGADVGDGFAAHIEHAAVYCTQS